MKICILMGRSRAILEETSYPLYLTEIQGEMLISHLIKYFSGLLPSEILCCYLEEDEQEFHISSILRHSSENIRSIIIPAETQGALCTALLASPFLDQDEELVLAAVDELFDISPQNIITEFQEKKFDVGLISFKSLHPAYAHVKRTKSGKVAEVVTKQAVSHDAVTSFFYFRKASIFIEAAKSVIRKDTPINNFFYLSQAINETVLSGLQVGLIEIPRHIFHPLKNQMQINDYFISLKSRQADENS